MKIAIVLFAGLLLACSQEPKVKVETEIIRVPVEVVREVEVIKEVEVVREVEVIKEVAPANCPPASEVHWLIGGLQDARAVHQAWADFLFNNPPEEGSLLKQSVGSSDEQLAIVVIYNRRLSITQQLQQACAQ